MPALHKDFANALLDWLCRRQAFSLAGATAAVGSGPTSFWIGLLTTAATATTTGTEVSGGGYARVEIQTGTAYWTNTQGTTSGASTGTDGEIETAVDLTFAAPSGANWGTVVGAAAYAASSGGNPLLFGTLSTPKTINDGDAAPVFLAGTLKFKMV